MATLFVLHQPVCYAKQAIGFAPIAGVPPVLHTRVDRFAAGGTPYPPRCRGGKFNKLAPHAPEGLHAPCLRMMRQRRCGRSPPSLKSVARHGSPCPARPKSVILSAMQKR